MIGWLLNETCRRENVIIILESLFLVLAVTHFKILIYQLVFGSSLFELAYNGKIMGPTK